MILSLLLGLATWAIVATCFLVKTIKNNERLADFDRASAELLKKHPAEKKLDAHISLQELKEKHVPWFQKSLSTLGVIAFFSMSAAALTQTISAQLNEFKAQSAEQRYKDVKETAEATERANVRSIKAILALIDADSYVSKEMTDLLYDRLDNLGNRKRPFEHAASDLKERMKIAMALGNVDCAAQVWLASSDITLSELNINPADIVTFGELYYLIRDDASARRSLAQFDSERNTSESAAVRAAALDIALTKQDPANLLVSHVEKLSESFNGDSAQIKNRLSQHAEQLRTKRIRMRLDPKKDYCSLRS